MDNAALWMQYTSINRPVDKIELNLKLMYNLIYANFYMEDDDDLDINRAQQIILSTGNYSI